jgi:hypothetical protein
MRAAEPHTTARAFALTDAFSGLGTGDFTRRKNTGEESIFATEDHTSIPSIFDIDNLSEREERVRGDIGGGI